MMKIVRSADGKVVAYGPHQENDAGEDVSGFSPSFPDGGSVSIEDDATFKTNQAAYYAEIVAGNED